MVSGSPQASRLLENLSPDLEEFRPGDLGTLNVDSLHRLRQSSVQNRVANPEPHSHKL